MLQHVKKLSIILPLLSTVDVILTPHQLFLTQHQLCQCWACWSNLYLN